VSRTAAPYLRARDSLVQVRNRTAEDPVTSVTLARRALRIAVRKAWMCDPRRDSSWWAVIVSCGVTCQWRGRCPRRGR
jgi:hypothetical protein